MSGITPVPSDVAQMVNSYVYEERSDAEKYDNREPLDESGRYGLQRLAAAIYARGFADGHSVAGIERRDL